MSSFQCRRLLQRLRAEGRWVVRSMQLLLRRWTGGLGDLSLLFDAGYYLWRYPDVAEAGWPPLAHFLKNGAGERRDPHPLFDTAFYLAENPDVAAAGVNPLAHWLHDGAREGRDPHPLFDTSFYLAENPEVAAAGVNPLVHWLRCGAREGRDPHPLFDTSFYTENTPGLSGTSRNPLLHWVSQGAHDRRNPHPMFDCHYYASQEPVLDAAVEDLLTHYLLSDGTDARSPHPDFDPLFYLAHNPDVQHGGWNPLVHFVSSGLEEGRSGKAPQGLANLEAAWRQLADIDSELRSSPVDIGRIWVRRAPRHREALAFRAFTAAIAPDIEALFLFPSLPSLVSSAPALRRLVHALTASPAPARAVALVTDQGDSGQAVSLEAGTEVVILDDLDRSLTPERRTRLVTQIVLNYQPCLVCDCGSNTAERAFTRHSRALRSLSRLGLFVPRASSVESVERRLRVLGGLVSVVLLENEDILRRSAFVPSNGETVDVFVLSDQDEPLTSRSSGAAIHELATPDGESR